METKLGNIITLPMLSLKEFILRVEVLELYKSFWRATRRIEKLDERVELWSWIRNGELLCSLAGLTFDSFILQKTLKNLNRNQAETR